MSAPRHGLQAPPIGRRRWFDSAGLTLTVVLAACSTSSEPTDGTPSATPAVPSTAAVEVASPSVGATSATQPAIAGATSIAGDVATYTDTVLGYAIDYPATWFVQAWQPGSAVIITSYNPEAAAGRGGIPPTAAKVDIMPLSTAPGASLEAMVTEIRAQSSAIVADAAIELPSGQPAQRLTFDNGDGSTTAMLVTVVDGRGLSIVGYGDLVRFDEVAQSIRQHGRPEQ